MKRFLADYRGKQTTILAETAMEALEKFANREFFGNRRIWNYEITLVDADTRGGEWVEAWTLDGINREEKIFVHLEENQ